MKRLRSSTRVVKGLHQFTLENYSVCKGLRQGDAIHSNSFNVGGHEWVVTVYVNGTQYDSIDGGDRYKPGHVHLGLHVTLLTGSDVVRCLVRMKLLDQSGKGNHMTMSMFDSFPCMAPMVILSGHYGGFPCFIEQNYLERSPYLKDNCLKIECTVGVVLPSSEIEIRAPSVVVPQCGDAAFGFLSMFNTGVGSDMIFHVRDEKFHVHKLILAARSTVFQDIFAHKLIPNQREILINGVEPRVFKAVLHFIYSDTLPEGDIRSLETGYAFGPSVSSTYAAQVLEAADEYGLMRLKNICESYLWRSISLNRFAETLSLAERHNASVLKHLCFKYAADNYYALVDLDNFAYLKKYFPLLLTEMDKYVLKEKNSKPVTSG